MEQPPTFSLKGSLPSHLHSERLTLELFDSTQEQNTCMLTAINSASFQASMGDVGITTAEQCAVYNRRGRLQSATVGGRTVDADILYFFPAARGPPGSTGCWS